MRSSITGARQSLQMRQRRCGAHKSQDEVTHPGVVPFIIHPFMQKGHMMSVDNIPLMLTAKAGPQTQLQNQEVWVWTQNSCRNSRRRWQTVHTEADPNLQDDSESSREPITACRRPLLGAQSDQYAGHACARVCTCREKLQRWAAGRGAAPGSSAATFSLVLPYWLPNTLQRSSGVIYPASLKLHIYSDRSD